MSSWHVQVHVCVCVSACVHVCVCAFVLCTKHHASWFWPALSLKTWKVHLSTSIYHIYTIHNHPPLPSPLAVDCTDVPWCSCQPSWVWLWHSESMAPPSSTRCLSNTEHSGPALEIWVHKFSTNFGNTTKRVSSILTCYRKSHVGTYTCIVCTANQLNILVTVLVHIHVHVGIV